jgi:hypothetical protein
MDEVDDNTETGIYRSQTLLRKQSHKLSFLPFPFFYEVQIGLVCFSSKS